MNFHSLNMQPVYSGEKFSFFISTNNLIFMEIGPYASLEIEDVYEIRKINQTLAKNNTISIVVSAGSMATLSKEARNEILNHGMFEKVKAIAIILDNLGQVIAANFFIKLSKRKNIKIFNNSNNALEWIAAFNNDTLPVN